MKMTHLTHPFTSNLTLAALLSTGACSGAMPAQPLLKSPEPSGATEFASSSSEPSSAVAAAAPEDDAAAASLPAFCSGSLAGPPFEARAKANLIQKGFVFVEGPVWSQKEGVFYFSEMDFSKEGPDGPPSKIHRLSLGIEGKEAKVEVFIEQAGSNGLAIDEQGLLACTHDTQAISRYSLETKERSVVVGSMGGKHFNSPNDVTVHREGHIYFSDPDWQIGERKSETGVTGVYMMTKDGVVSLIDGSLPKPNGVTLSPDQSRLYVGAVDGAVYVYPVDEDGSVGDRKLFSQVPEPDGMGVDCAGNLYVTSHGPGEVVVLSPEAQVVSRIQVAPKTTNVAFGGADRKTLLITAGTGIYSIRSALPGFPY